MDIDISNEIVEKAKSKNDGVYSHKKYAYLVRKHKFIAYVDRNGNVYQCFGHFVTQIGKCIPYWTEKRKALLKVS